MKRIVTALVVTTSLALAPQVGAAHIPLLGAGLVQADTPQSCPVVVIDTTLQTDCIAPMVIAADNVTVDLNHHQVYCASRYSGTGINLTNRYGVHIANGRVDGCQTGLGLDGGGNNRVAGLLIDDNQFGADGSTTSGNEFVADRVINNHTTGFELAGASNHNSFTFMAIDSNGDTGGRGGLILDFGPSYTSVSTSDLSYNYGFGMYTHSADQQTVVRNVRIAFTKPGRTDYSFAALIQGRGFDFNSSLVTNNYRFGILGANGVGGTIHGNTVANNTGSGIVLVSQSSITVRSNKVTDNGGDGISVGLAPNDVSTTGNLFTENTSRGNSGYDLADYPPGPCTLNTWEDNEGQKLYDGCENGKQSNRSPFDQ